MAGRDVTDGVTSLTGRLTSLQTRNVVEPRKRRKILNNNLFFLPAGLECEVILSSSTTEDKRNLRNFLKQSRLQPQHDFPKTHIETLLPKSPSRPRHYRILANGTGDGKEKSVNTQSKTDRLFSLLPLLCFPWTSSTDQGSIPYLFPGSYSIIPTARPMDQQISVPRYMILARSAQLSFSFSSSSS